MNILTDPRKIAGIYFDDDEGSCYEAALGFTIEAYPEPGTLHDLVYFAVYDETKKLVARVPAWKVTVIYN